MFSEKIWNVSERLDLGNLPGEAGILPLTAQVLVNRGINTASSIKTFIDPKISSISEPDFLPGIKEATLLINKAIKDKKKIYVFGDFDVDGITSTAILLEALKSLKANVDYYIPCRFKEGYGLNVTAIKELAKKGCELLITVDCGITAHKEVEEAKRLGMDVIITDHHQAEPLLPSADFVINPVLTSMKYTLAGAGVAYQLARMLIGYDSDELLELVSLGSIADLVVLKDDNRALVSEGLKKLNRSKRAGLIALAKVSGFEMGNISSYSVAFGLAPRLNAGGRLNNALEPLELLLTNDDEKAMSIATKLDKFNRERREIEDKMLNEAKEILNEKFDPDRDKVIILAKEGWHEGVKGIVASRVQKEFCRPTFICSEKDGLIKGSGRSFGELDLKKVLDECSSLLDNYGGHPAAAGITLNKNNLRLFKEKFNSIATDIYQDKELKPEIEIDAEIDSEEFNEEAVIEINKLQPFGNGNPEPVFCLRNAYVKNQKLLGQKAIKVLKFDVQAGGKSLPAIAFTDNKKQAPSDSIDIAFSMDENVWQGRTSIQAKVKNVRLHKFSLDKPAELVEHLFKIDSGSGRYENIAYAQSFFTKVAGVSFDGRQEMITQVKEGEALLFIREPDNAYDQNAVRVDTVKGINLGYLNRDLAANLSPHMDLGIRWTGEVGSVTGGGGKNFGVNILVKRKDDKKVSARLINDKITDPVLIKKTLLGDIRLHKKQTEAIQSLKDNKNTLLIMGTGRGKSAVFHLHAAVQATCEDKITIVLYPLRSLIRDQFLYLESAMSKVGVKVVKLTGESGIEERANTFEELKNGLCHIVLTTPEFLFHNLPKFEDLKERISFFVADEAHHLQTASFHHRPVYRTIHKVLPRIGSPVTLAATATANEETADEIVKQLSIENIVIDTTVRKNLLLEDKRGVSNKERAISNIISEGKKTVIYTNSRDITAKLAENLSKLSPEYKKKVVYYHAGLNSEMRELVQDGFKKGVFSTIVATSAFGEGVNIPDIENLVLYHLPFNLIQYNQQCGRAGRNGEPANIHLLYGQKDAGLNDFILENICPRKETLRKLYAVIKKMAKGCGIGSSGRAFIANKLDILAEYELSGFSGLTEKGIGSSLKVFAELGLIEIRNEEEGTMIKIIDKKKVQLEDSTLFEEAQNEKNVFNEFKETALKAEVSDLLKLFNQPIYPENYLEEKVLEQV